MQVDETIRLHPHHTIRGLFFFFFLVYHEPKFIINNMADSDHRYRLTLA